MGMVESWAQGIVAFATFLIALPIVVRFFDTDRRLMELIVGTGSAIFIVWVVVLGAAFDERTFWGFLAIYGFLFISFLQAFAIIYKSISLRMLVEIANVHGAALPFDAAHHALVVNGAYARRLANLEAGGFLTRTGPSIQLTGKGKKAVHQLTSAQRLFRVANSG